MLSSGGWDRGSTVLPRASPPAERRPRPKGPSALGRPLALFQGPLSFPLAPYHFLFCASSPLLDVLASCPRVLPGPPSPLFPCVLPFRTHPLAFSFSGGTGRCHSPAFPTRIAKSNHNSHPLRILQRHLTWHGERRGLHRVCRSEGPRRRTGNVRGASGRGATCTSAPRLAVPGRHAAGPFLPLPFST